MSTQSALTNPEAKRAGAISNPAFTELQKLQILLGIWDGIEGHPVTPRELQEWKWVPNDDWRRGEGLLSDHPEHDTSKMKANERAWEEEHDARKFGWTRRP